MVVVIGYDKDGWPKICECGDEIWAAQDVSRHSRRHKKEEFDSLEKYGLCGPCHLGVMSPSCTCPKGESAQS